MKHTIQNFRLFALTITLLNGCGWNNDKTLGEAPPLLPIIEPMMRQELSDQYVTRAVQDYIKLKHAPSFSEYDFMRVDLDQDGWQDALIHLTAPYGQWCNKSGCTVLALHARENGFSLVGEISSIRPPFYISDTQTNGWRNLIVRVSGRIEKAKDVVLRFNGSEYPNSPIEFPASNSTLHPIHLKAFP